MAWWKFGRKTHDGVDPTEDDEDRDDAQEESEAEASDSASDLDGKPETVFSDEEDDEGSEDDEDDLLSDEDVDEDGQDDPFPVEPSEEYEDRGDLYGPWDLDEENAPDDGEYLDLGGYLLPVLPGMELRVKAARATKQVLGCIVTFGRSSLEIEPFAAPKTLGLWDDVRADLLDGNEKATEHPGIFGMEVALPVGNKAGRTLHTRIVGVDGPRWMLRGIFSGPAATESGGEAAALNGFFASIIVVRGEDPLAPRDLIPLHAPLTPEQRRKAEEDSQKADDEDETKDDTPSIPKRPTGPFDSDQQTEVKSTLSRGPMFSEVR
ncbi:DUF3710 domain-containing protein [uncultured Bifidobacterium sp.]|uniref:DUF3710 domain-containing protein n=1 Tax=uncultured Bifidobacterium sp. TaxID=165187 RepID=UPI0028DB7E23|nr:DUF3710 domain-containing protein [uncultured Bifidobacterium sp.]